jgi:hypothetical protein
LPDHHALAPECRFFGYIPQIAAFEAAPIRRSMIKPATGGTA